MERSCPLQKRKAKIQPATVDEHEQWIRLLEKWSIKTKLKKNRRWSSMAEEVGWTRVVTVVADVKENSDDDDDENVLEYRLRMDDWWDLRQLDVDDSPWWDKHQ